MAPSIVLNGTIFMDAPPNSDFVAPVAAAEDMTAKKHLALQEVSGRSITRGLVGRLVDPQQWCNCMSVQRARDAATFIISTRSLARRHARALRWAGALAANR